VGGPAAADTQYGSDPRPAPPALEGQSDELALGNVELGACGEDHGQRAIDVI
jgi:hypothetical protein